MFSRWSLIILLLTLLLSSPVRTRAEPQTGAFEKKLNPAETQKVLAFLAKKLSANLNAIKTWQGTCRFLDKIYFDLDGQTDRSGNVLASYWETTQGQLPFWLDQKQDKLRVNYELFAEPDVLQLTPQEPSKANSPLNSQWIVRGEECFALADRQVGRKKEFPKRINGRILYRWIKDELYSNGRFFDPRSLFGLGSEFSDSFAKKCDMYAMALSGEKGEEQKQKALKLVSIMEKTDKAGHKQYIVSNRYPSQEPDTVMRLIEVTYDSRFGFNAIKYEKYFGKKLRYKRIFTYKKVDGIYLPEKVIIERYRNMGAPHEELIKSRTFTLVESKLNGPIDPSLFEVKSLNLKYGERMWDSFKNQAFIQDREGLVPAKEFVFK